MKVLYVSSVKNSPSNFIQKLIYRKDYKPRIENLTINEL